DITVIIPIININIKELKRIIRSILAYYSFQIFIITRKDKFFILEKFSRIINIENLEVFIVLVTNKCL
ncbi:hypothetical protein F5882DRAFT_311354, partial [Hyaloscypha sp. PMI_1271]